MVWDRHKNAYNWIEPPDNWIFNGNVEIKHVQIPFHSNKLYTITKNECQHKRGRYKKRIIEYFYVVHWLLGKKVGHVDYYMYPLTL